VISDGTTLPPDIHTSKEAVHPASVLKTRRASSCVQLAASSDVHCVLLGADEQLRFAELLLDPPPLSAAMRGALKARKSLFANLT
jgi:hypothetical protein